MRKLHVNVLTGALLTLGAIVATQACKRPASTSTLRDDSSVPAACQSINEQLTRAREALTQRTSVTTTTDFLDTVRSQDKELCEAVGGAVWDPSDNGCLCPMMNKEYGSANIRLFCERGRPGDVTTTTNFLDTVDSQDEQLCRENGGTWVPSDRGCNCPSGMQYGSANIRLHCQPSGGSAGGRTDGDAACSYHGRMETDGSCQCFDGYYGTTCSEEGASLTGDHPVRALVPTQPPKSFGLGNEDAMTEEQLRTEIADLERQLQECRERARTGGGEPSADLIASFKTACENQGGAYRQDSSVAGGHKCICLSSGGMQAISGYTGGSTVFQSCERVNLSSPSSDVVNAFRASCSRAGGTYAAADQKCTCRGSSSFLVLQAFLEGGGMTDDDYVSGFCGSGTNSGGTTGRTDEDAFRSACTSVANGRVVPGSSPLLCECQGGDRSSSSISVWRDTGSDANYYVQRCGRRTSSSSTSPGSTTPGTTAPATSNCRIAETVQQGQWFCTAWDGNSPLAWTMSGCSTQMSTGNFYVYWNRGQASARASGGTARDAVRAKAQALGKSCN